MHIANVLHCSNRNLKETVEYKQLYQTKTDIGLCRQKKPYTAITVQIDRLTSEQYEEDDISGVFDLVEVIRLQSSGPTEAARAIRKKL